jgi:dihydroorotase
MRFDLLIKGGEVIDPAAGLSGRMDIAVNRNRIAAVESEIPADSAYRVIDASGQFVTPGLIDMHAHLYRNSTYWGIDADAVGSQCGVTTWLDAGSTGAVTFPGFREYVIEKSRTRIFALINIAYIGLVAQDYELANPEYCNVELLERVANLNRDVIVGIKVRAGRSGAAKDLEPFKRARQAADDLNLPIMVHLSTQPPDLATVLGFLKPGDILTHIYTGQTMGMVDKDGKILEVAKKAYEEGLIMDLGHGAGSFSFPVAESLVSQGYYPDTISTDLHWLSIVGPNLMDPLKGSAFGTTSDVRSLVVQVTDDTPVFDLLTCMTKMLCVGMSFPEVVRRVTNRPAEILGVKGEIGTLKPGAIADITGLTIDKGSYELRDIHGNVRYGKEKVRCTFTILSGQPFDPIEIPQPPAWVQVVERV